MPPRLQVKNEDCSPLGLYVLQYLEEQDISMNHLAELAGVPQPRLRGACFKGTCPTPETLRKLAKVMGNHHLELYTLAYQGRIEQVPEDVDDNLLDILIRQMLETARELNLAMPKTQPSKAKIRKALIELGFREKREEFL
ncbi:helix-turn-helix domain-containing protein [Pseudanabaena mucicola]|uniref:Helix-turn-helix transcriptional regulator n=1 Tax=Pseudanabaena mucicola FACHB-723 TaxID=2692860 RepID=A0ABR7ZUH3_9CYAN|nr:helix-turn-helix transcriptional regulator [Pseudanabaena mucicola]MBD2187405.1 helix-turn-helix transcriptional regulator [Pseudanabaena mucicola FACHB-723]